MKDYEQIEKRLIEIQNLIKDIKLFREMYFNLDRKLEREFFDKYQYILLGRNTISFNNRYVEMFDVIIRALNHHRDVNAFYDIRCLIDIRNKYIELLHDGDMNKEYDICKLSKYIIAYAYYNNLELYEVDNILGYLCENYDEVIEWATMNQGVSVLEIYVYLKHVTIKKDFYSYVVKYLINKTSNKQIIK